MLSIVPQHCCGSKPGSGVQVRLRRAGKHPGPSGEKVNPRVAHQARLLTQQAQTNVCMLNRMCTHAHARVQLQPKSQPSHMAAHLSVCASPPWPKQPHSSQSPTYMAAHLSVCVPARLGPSNLTAGPGPLPTGNCTTGPAANTNAQMGHDTNSQNRWCCCCGSHPSPCVSAHVGQQWCCYPDISIR